MLATLMSLHFWFTFSFSVFKSQPSLNHFSITSATKQKTKIIVQGLHSQAHAVLECKGLGMGGMYHN